MIDRHSDTTKTDALTLGLLVMGQETRAAFRRLSRRALLVFSRSWFSKDTREARLEAEVDRWQNEGGHSADGGSGSW